MRYDGNVSTDAGVSPGFIRTDFAESITDVATKASVKAMDDVAISPEAVARAIALQTLLAALSFGQGNCDRLDTSDSLFNRVARDLSVDMKNHWRPDAVFFGKRNREQLIGIAKECGYADGNGSLGGYKKSELTSSLVRHFVNAHSSGEPTE